MSKHRGFTLIELLVVIAVIVILIAILIPTLSKVKAQSQATKTAAQLSQLSSAIESYYQRFAAYPGPVGPAGTGGQGANKVMSGAQNLLLGLSYSVTRLSTSSDYIPLPPGGSPPLTGFVNPHDPTGPTDNADLNPLGNPTKVLPFYQVTTNISKTDPPTSKTFPPGGVRGIFGASGNTFRFPVIVDSFTDALPILYYRRLPGVQTLPAAATPPQYVPNLNNAAYIWSDNTEYTRSSTLEAITGQICVQNPSNNPKQPKSQLATYDQNNAVMALNNIIETPTARGGYILMSAGIDRVYSKNLTTGKPSDDIVIVGGN